MNADCGVLVGRFQVPYLHDGHIKVIDEIFKNHKKVLIFIGVSQVKNTRRNPLDFTARVRMILKQYPKATVLQIPDQPSDKEWSKELNTRIREVCPTESVILYGSRDGFIPKYSGEFKTVELAATKSISGSEVRSMVSKEVIDSVEFRKGVIYASFNKYPISFTTVDAAVVNTSMREVLLARKKNEKRLRFIGGFVDITKDNSLKSAVKREVSEETNALGVGEATYIGSTRIDDWRYRNEVDGIMTAFFFIPYMFGIPRACDDVFEMHWINVFTLFENYDIIVDEHRPLVKMLHEQWNTLLNVE